MSGGVLGVFGHERLEFSFCALVLDGGFTGAPVDRRKFGPGVRGAHVDHPDRFQARPRRLVENFNGRMRDDDGDAWPLSVIE
jgi:hypothetical protein